MYIVKESEAYRHITDSTILAEEPWKPVLYTVTAKKKENDDLATLTLEPSGEETVRPIKPGQFNMLYAFGMGEIPISVSSLLESWPILTHTIQNVGAISGALCNVEIGDEIGVRGPFGSAWPLEVATDRDIIVMAGGLGIAPLRPVIENLNMNRAKYGEINVLFGTRSPDNIIYHQNIISWQANPSITFHITVDHAYSHWHGNVGVVTDLLSKTRFDPENTIAYLCGPEIMMRYGAYACLDHNIPEQNIYLSMERNMKCALGHCGHCQYGHHFVCKDGPVFQFPVIKSFLKIGEL